MRRWVSALPDMVFAVNEERLQRTGIQHYVLSSNSFDNFLSQFQDANPVRAGAPPPLRFDRFVKSSTEKSSRASED